MIWDGWPFNSAQQPAVYNAIALLASSGLPEGNSARKIYRANHFLRDLFWRGILVIARTARSWRFFGRLAIWLFGCLVIARTAQQSNSARTVE